MMKIRSIFYAFCVIGGLLMAVSCQNEENVPVALGEEHELVLLPSIGKMNQEIINLRSGSNPFFENNDQITVKVTTSRNKNSPHLYTYNSGVFTGDFKFMPDNTYITKLEALWPAEGSKGRSEVITDQRKYSDYKQANRLKAVGSTDHIMPTAASVPLVFEHEQSSITFRLAGQNANGLIIKSLLLELDDTRPVDGLGKKGFWAYCGDETEDANEEGKGALNAKLILPQGIQFGPNQDDDGRMKIGLVTVGESGNSSKDYEGIIYIPNRTNITLEANTDYLVTLTPEGYDLEGIIYIANFPQAEGHVGIPYQVPTLITGEPENPNVGKYEIKTLAQLVTISWLLSEEELPSEWWNTATVWNTKSFVITSDIKVTDKVKAKGDYYLKESVLKSNKSLFTGTDKVTYSDNSKVFGD